MALMKTRRGALAATVAGNALYPLLSQGALTLSAGVITDVTRLAGVEGDGETYPASRAGVWPAATNLITNGGFETNTTGWVAWASGASIARVTTEAKFGSASLQVTVADLGSRGTRYIASLSAATAYTVSAWLKIPVGKTVGIYVYDTPVTSELVGVVSAGTGDWVRVSATFTSDADGGNHSIFIMTYGDNDAVVFYVDGVQCETGSIATPYIETDGGTASRVAPTISTAHTKITTKGWVAIRFRQGHASTTVNATDKILFTLKESANVRFEMAEFASNGDRFYARAVDAGGISIVYDDVSADRGSTFAIGDYITLIGGWKNGGNVYHSYNGGAFLTAANARTVSAPSEIYIGQWHLGGYNPAGSYMWVAAGAGELTNADAALFHAWGNNDPLPHQFPRSAQLTFLAGFNADGTMYRYAV